MNSVAKPNESKSLENRIKKIFASRVKNNFKNIETFENIHEPSTVPSRNNKQIEGFTSETADELEKVDESIQNTLPIDFENEPSWKRDFKFISEIKPKDLGKPKTWQNITRLVLFFYPLMSEQIIGSLTRGFDTNKGKSKNRKNDQEVLTHSAYEAGYVVISIYFAHLFYCRMYCNDICKFFSIDEIIDNFLSGFMKNSDETKTSSTEQSGGNFVNDDVAGSTSDIANSAAGISNEPNMIIRAIKDWLLLFLLFAPRGIYFFFENILKKLVGYLPFVEYHTLNFFIFFIISYFLVYTFLGKISNMLLGIFEWKANPITYLFILIGFFSYYISMPDEVKKLAALSTLGFLVVALLHLMVSLFLAPLCQLILVMYLFYVVFGSPENIINAFKAIVSGSTPDFFNKVHEKCSEKYNEINVLKERGNTVDVNLALESLLYYLDVFAYKHGYTFFSTFIAILFFLFKTIQCAIELKVPMIKTVFSIVTAFITLSVFLTYVLKNKENYFTANANTIFNKQSNYRIVQQDNYPHITDNAYLYQ